MLSCRVVLVGLLHGAFRIMLRSIGRYTAFGIGKMGRGCLVLYFSPRLFLSCFLTAPLLYHDYGEAISGDIP